MNLDENATEEYDSLLRCLRWTDGFGLIFACCSPGMCHEIISQVKEDIPEKKIEVLHLEESVDSLYDLVDKINYQQEVNVLFITGIENSLQEYEAKNFSQDSNKHHFDSWKGVPRILGNLNLQRDRFRDDFQICFVFLLPLFALKYFIHRAPDFFDWRSGVFEFISEQEITSKVTSFQEYLNLSVKERKIALLELRAFLKNEKQSLEPKEVFLIQGLLLSISEEYESAILNFNQTLELEPNNGFAWYHRGYALKKLGRYDEAINSFAKSWRILYGNFQSQIFHEILQSLLTQLQQVTTASKENCYEVATRLANEVIRDCQQSDQNKSTEEIAIWVEKKVNYVLQQCLNYYNFGSKQGRIELQSTLSSIIYSHIPASVNAKKYPHRLNLIEDFLQGFYAEALNAFRREVALDDSYKPRTLLELSEYMAFCERYARRIITQKKGRRQKLIVLRAKKFCQQLRRTNGS